MNLTEEQLNNIVSSIRNELMDYIILLNSEIIKCYEIFKLNGLEQNHNLLVTQTERKVSNIIQTISTDKIIKSSIMTRL